MTTFIPEASTSVTTGVIARIYDGESIVDIISELEETVPWDARIAQNDLEHSDSRFLARAAAGQSPDVTALIAVLARFGCSLAVVPTKNGHAGGYGRPWAEFS